MILGKGSPSANIVELEKEVGGPAGDLELTIAKGHLKLSKMISLVIPYERRVIGALSFLPTGKLVGDFFELTTGPRLPT
jgi:hypothetical protein